MGALNDAMHINAGQVDVIGIKAADRHNFFDLHDADLAAHGCGRIEVARCLAEDCVARGIRLPCFDDGQIGENTFFEDVILSTPTFYVLTLGNHGAYAGFGVEPGNTGTSCAHPLGQCTLRVELQLQLT